MTETEKIAWLQSNINLLLNQISKSSNCHGCGKEIYWITLKSGKKAPYTPEALNHFADCEKADLFRKK